MTESQLLQRLAAEPRIPAASSFASEAVADAAAYEALTANSAAITQWLAGKASRYVGAAQASGSVGISVSRGSSGAVSASGVRFVLQRDATMATGYRIVTIYPE
ncbi:MAG: hypothetical protein GX591_04245 [Planctomycetes bacterium]|nr:hypothetical protein [Planctomycetota bacterium]